MTILQRPKQKKKKKQARKGKFLLTQNFIPYFQQVNKTF